MSRIQASVEDTILEQSREEAKRQGKTLDDLVGEALHFYLRHRPVQGRQSAVARTWASVPLERSQVQAILNEEDDFLGA